jgi:riboflavin-specific deaminase-like protein
MAMTVDGKITSAAREYPAFASAHDLDNLDRLRAEADVVIVGAGTMRADEAPITVRSEARVAERRQKGMPPQPWVVVVSQSLALAPTSRFFAEARGRTIIATVQAAAPSPRQALADVAEVWTVGEAEVDVRQLLDRLQQRGLARVVLEGGALLNWAFVAADVIDELHITIAPAILGGRDAPTVVGGAGLAMALQRRLRLRSVRQVGDELFCVYERDFGPTACERSEAWARE